MIQNFSAATNDRFANDPSFVGSGYDWSGVGRSSDGRWGTMLSRSAFLSANHYHPGIGSVMNFYPANDPAASTVTRTVVNGARIGSTDLWIGYLDSGLPNSVAEYPYAQISVTEASFASTVLFLESAFLSGISPTSTGYGAAGASRQAVGTNLLEDFFEDIVVSGATGDVLATIQNQAGDSSFGYTMSGSEAHLQGGDSGAPLMIVDGGELMVAGINWAIGTTDIDPGAAVLNRPISVFTYTGSYTGQILVMIPEAGSAGFVLLAGIAVMARRRRGSGNYPAGGITSR